MRLWLYCVKYSLTIQTDLPEFILPWSQDIEFKWLFAQQRFHGHDLMTLDQCGMALRAIWLSNMHRDSGVEGMKLAWEGGDPVKPLYKWPIVLLHLQRTGDFGNRLFSTV